jgi:transcriptional regulator with XRE-family HTH domain
MTDRENKSLVNGLDKSSLERQHATDLDSKADLIYRLKRSRAARMRFVESHVAKTIAFQTQSMRAKKGWTQQELAKRLGSNQNAVYRLENPYYGKQTITTLRKVASEFDVALMVRFVPFSQLIDWVTGNPHLIPGLSEESLVIEDFEHDSGLNTEILKPSEDAVAELSNLCDAIRSELLAEGQTEDIDAELGRGKTIGAAASQDLEEKQKSGHLVLMRIGLNQGAAAAQGELEKEAA